MHNACIIIIVIFSQNIQAIVTFQYLLQFTKRYMRLWLSVLLFGVLLYSSVVLYVRQVRPFTLPAEVPYVCVDQPQRARTSATSRRVDSASYDAIIARFHLTTSQFCQLDDATLAAARTVIANEKSVRHDESLTAFWHEIEAWMFRATGLSEAEREATAGAGEGAVADPAYFTRRLRDEYGNIPAMAGATPKRISLRCGRYVRRVLPAFMPMAGVSSAPNNVAGRTRAIAVDRARPMCHIPVGYRGDFGKVLMPVIHGSPSMISCRIWRLALLPSTLTILIRFMQVPVKVVNTSVGDGIFRSTNAGTTWTQLASTAIDAVSLNDTFRFVNKIIAVNNNATTTLYAATWKGVRRSTRWWCYMVYGDSGWCGVYQCGDGCRG
jgi:hypothetical protein